MRWDLDELENVPRVGDVVMTVVSMVAVLHEVEIDVLGDYYVAVVVVVAVDYVDDFVAVDNVDDDDDDGLADVDVVALADVVEVAVTMPEVIVTATEMGDDAVCSVASQTAAAAAAAHTSASMLHSLLVGDDGSLPVVSQMDIDVRFEVSPNDVRS